MLVTLQYHYFQNDKLFCEIYAPLRCHGFERSEIPGR